MMTDSLRTTVRILDEDRTFGLALSPDDLSAARRYAVADVHELGRGSYTASELSDGSGLLGLLVLDGLLVRQVGMAGRRCGEIIGPGALLRPWDDDGTGAPLPFELDWRVLQPVRLALLDRRFLAAILRWPPLIEAFVERATERAHTLAFNVAIHCVQRVDVRLLLLFWHLADRFGKVTPAGTVVPLALSHSDLAELVGAARPSVSTALKELADQGHVQRNRSDRSWLLCSDLAEQLRAVQEHGARAGTNNSARPV
jgi:CRP/FNR family cyclic AMP-dependent transcriptional regulator